MSERLRVLDERYTLQKPASVGEQKFKTENPNANWEDLLLHLLDNYSHRDWRLEGSAAVALYHPGQIVPKDIDILTPSQEFAEQFGLPPGKFDVRPTNLWLQLRGLPVNDSNLNYLMDATFTKKFKGRTVLVSAPSLLAFSKTYTYDGEGPRPKDQAHLRIMKVKTSSIERVHRRLKAA